MTDEAQTETVEDEQTQQGPEPEQAEPQCDHAANETPIPIPLVGMVVQCWTSNRETSGPVPGIVLSSLGDACKVRVFGNGTTEADRFLSSCAFLDTSYSLDDMIQRCKKYGQNGWCMLAQ